MKLMCDYCQFILLNKLKNIAYDEFFNGGEQDEFFREGPGLIKNISESCFNSNKLCESENIVKNIKDNGEILSEIIEILGEQYERLNLIEDKQRKSDQLKFLNKKYLENKNMQISFLETL